MASTVRIKMVEGALDLLTRYGLEGTSFNEVLERTQTPRGSIYHHFPRGKEQLIQDALELACIRTGTYLDQNEDYSPQGVVSHFYQMWENHLKRSDFQAGCAATAVLVATESPKLIKAAHSELDKWLETLTSQLHQGGMGQEAAHDFSVIILSSIEGAVLLCRAAHSIKPLQTVKQQLLQLSHHLDI